MSNGCPVVGRTPKPDEPETPTPSPEREVRALSFAVDKGVLVPIDEATGAPIDGVLSCAVVRGPDGKQTMTIEVEIG